jgi:hypothetical protein
VPRKKVAVRPPMKAVSKVAETPTTEQLNLDFEGRAPPKAKAKAPRVRKAPPGIDIPQKPKG